MAGAIYLVYYIVVSVTVMQLRNQSDCFTCTVDSQSEYLSPTIAGPKNLKIRFRDTERRRIYPARQSVADLIKPLEVQPWHRQK